MKSNGNPDLIFIACCAIFMCSMATAQTEYQTIDTRQACHQDHAQVPIFDKVDGDQIAHHKRVTISDISFGKNEVAYFLADFNQGPGDNRQKGYVRTDDVRHFCGTPAKHDDISDQFHAPPNTCHLIGARLSTVEEINTAVQDFPDYVPTRSAYATQDGHYELSLGLIRSDSFGFVLRGAYGLPADSFCSAGRNFVGVLEKLENGFRAIRTPQFEDQTSRLRAATKLRREADETRFPVKYKHACDLGDRFACARYAHALGQVLESTDFVKTQQNHYNLLGCMRGDGVACHNAVFPRGNFLDQTF